ncbi:hypothetical protein QLR68_29550, partial [Micromonospora sp. DH15]|nr:hypothetical protein [Micromonospora sp. DH15]
MWTKGASETSGVVGVVSSVDGSGAVAALRRLLAERIVVLDGAWGTMLQGAKLSPADYRGDLIGDDHPRDVTG